MVARGFHHGNLERLGASATLKRIETNYYSRLAKFDSKKKIKKSNVFETVIIIIIIIITRYNDRRFPFFNYFYIHLRISNALFKI